ncbi:heavy metal translocating P-type ATPase [Halosimplex pelagicum]|uniref:Cation-translocating P-type ATPase n=1 Tax=Halosimplex pelagicum TaxID=869886 RepID=A0A7D5TXG7_9EURY|nr:cation-translocating P-type ATPase [Halosimplex pelagicum]QLH84734.1 cation-translocating P-type ATPase [Halosimplex pelagicum]
MTNDDPDRPDGGDHDAADAGEACCGSDGCDTAAGAASGAAEGTEVRFSVPEMDCSSCASKVDAALSDREGVVATDLRPTTGTAKITYDAEQTSRADLVAAVESAGYPVGDDGSGSAGGDEAEAAAGAESVFRSARAKKTALSGLALGLGLLVQFGFGGLNGSLVAVAGRELVVADALYLLAVLAGGGVIVRNGYYSARNLSLDIDFLMSVAILSATGISLAVPDLHFYVEAASLAFLFNVAELLERYSVDRARNSLEELLTLSPDIATVRRASGPDGEPERVEVPVEDVAVGETVLVEPGEKIPMDGTVTEGSSAVNQAPITGESVPVDKAVGDEVFAGTINEQGFLAVETTAEAGDTTIDRIVELVEDAQANKTDREQFVERFADYYTPAVVVAALLATFVAPLVFGGGWATWFVRGISLLVIACPCAFVISTPVTVVSGVTSAAKNGVLIKGGDHLEAMGEVDAVAFDKTGTLTTGELSVTDVMGLNGNDEADVLQCARAIERRSEHPIGDAIVVHADERGVNDREVTDFESITGKGVRADLDGRTHYAGKPGLFEELGFDLDHVHLSGDSDPVTDGGVAVERAKRPCPDRDDCVDLWETVPRLQSAGKTVVLVGTDEEIEGVVAIADEVRPEARRTVERLREQGVAHLVMLTGDNERTARAVAEQVGVDEFHADLLPDEKVDRVEALREAYDTVAMVGDGINDAPALATATVGIAMGAAGTDTALETADVALMGDDLSKVPYLHRLARTGNGIIRQNVWGSLLVKAALAVAIPLPFVAVPLWFVVLAGDVGMTTAVTGNAMRLARLRPDPATA